MRLVLASGSPRRHNLLEEHGYDFTVVSPAVDEVAPAHLTPGEIVLCNACLKANAVARQCPNELVLGADTLVAHEGEVLGKPRDMAEALAMLKRLNGGAHEVFTGVCLVRFAAREERTFVERTRVQFRALTEPQLDGYLQRVAPLDKAGAYAAQEDQGELIEHVEGSFTNVIGLPMERLTEVLASFAFPSHGFTSPRRGPTGTP